MQATARNRFFPAAVLLAVLFAAGDASATGDGATGAIGQKRLNDDELRATSATGFPDFLFDRKSFYYADGNAVEIFGDSGRVLNLPPGLFGNLFTDLLVSTTNLSTLVDKNGNAFMRIDTYIDEVNIPETRIDSGPSFGAMRIRGIDLRGTTVSISKRGG